MWVKAALRRVWSFIRARPLFTLALLIVIVLGGRELLGTGGLSAEDRQILANQHATATTQTVATATALATQPVVDNTGTGPGETTAVAYPEGDWTIGWSYNCGPSLPHASFVLELYDGADTSYMHGTLVAKVKGAAQSGYTPERTFGRSDREFVLDPTTRCAWHIMVMRGRRAVFPSMPRADHT